MIQIDLREMAISATLSGLRKDMDLVCVKKIVVGRMSEKLYNERNRRKLMCRMQMECESSELLKKLL